MRLSVLAALASLALAMPVAAQTPDPVGDYTWSFSMANDQVVHGTMNLARSDSGYTATFTSDHTEGSLTTRSVTVNGPHVVVDLTGDFGAFTLDMQLADSITATYKLDTGDGPSSGPIAVQRVKKSASSAGLRRARRVARTAA